MDFQKRFPPDDVIWDYSNPLEAQQKAFKIYGPTAILYRSKVKNKKYSIVNPSGKIINFGQIGYEDFLKHKNLPRRNSYLTRTANMKGNWREDGYSANNLSRNILW